MAAAAASLCPPASQAHLYLDGAVRSRCSSCSSSSASAAALAAVPSVARPNASGSASATHEPNTDTKKLSIHRAHATIPEWPRTCSATPTLTRGRIEQVRELISKLTFSHVAADYLFTRPLLRNRHHGFFITGAQCLPGPWASTRLLNAEKHRVQLPVWISSRCCHDAQRSRCSSGACRAPASAPSSGSARSSWYNRPATEGRCDGSSRPHRVPGGEEAGSQACRV